MAATKTTECTNCEFLAIHIRGTTWTFVDEPDDSNVWDFCDDIEIPVWKCNNCGHFTMRRDRTTKLQQTLASLQEIP